MNEKMDSIDDTLIDNTHTTWIDYNISSLSYRLTSSQPETSIAVGGELKSFDYINKLLTFELTDLDKNIFLDFYNKLPLDKEEKRFKIKLEYQI